MLVYVDDFKKHHNDIFLTKYWERVAGDLQFKGTEAGKFQYLGMEQDYTTPGQATFSQAEFIRRMEECPVPKGSKNDDLAD